MLENDQTGIDWTDFYLDALKKREKTIQIFNEIILTYQKYHDETEDESGKKFWNDKIFTTRQCIRTVLDCALLDEL